MILEVPRRSLASPKVLIPVEALWNDARGSRLPDVAAALLTRPVAQRAVDACPTSALELSANCLTLNYGECTGCGNCYVAAPGVLFPAAKLARCGVGKSELVRRWDLDTASETPVDVPAETAGKIHALVGRALNVRQVDAGSCNGCEGEIAAMTNPYYDLERFGIHFVASPKHADMLLVTGPVTRNMAEAVRQTYEATPAPKLVVAVGACGCTGGIFAGSDAVVGGVDAVIPVDGYIPGCPPTPGMLLTGILHVLARRLAEPLPR